MGFLRLVDAVGWMLLHFLWQGAVIGLGVAVGLRVAASARVRYAVACGGLFLMAAAMPATLGWRIWEQATPTSAGISISQAPVSPTFPLRSTTAEPLSAGGIDGFATGHSPIVSPPENGPGLEARVQSRGGERGMWERAEKWVVEGMPWLVGAWLAGAMVLMVRLLTSWVAVRKLQLGARVLAEAEWMERVGRLAKRVGISRSVRLLVSGAAGVPMVIGLLRPAILVPASLLTEMSVAQLEAILAHELAHIGRHDYLIHHLQCLAEVVGYYHPAVWWVSRRVRAEREHCCDDMASAVAGKLNYARALAALEEYRGSRLVLAATGGSLLERIRRLAGVPVPRAEGVRVVWPLGVILIFGAVVWAAIPVVPQLADGAATTHLDAATRAGPPNPLVDGKVVCVTSAGKWDIGEGIVLVIEGAEKGMISHPERLTLHWKAVKDRPALQWSTDLVPAARPLDFDVQERPEDKALFTVAWEKDSNSLWMVNDGAVHHITFSDPAAIVDDINGRNNNGIGEMPAEIRKAMEAHFTIGRQPGPDGRIFPGGNVGGQSHDSAQTELPFRAKGTVRDGAGKGLANVVVAVQSEYSPTVDLTGTRTDERGNYALEFRPSLGTLNKFRGMMVAPRLEGFTERDLANAGEFTALFSADDENATRLRGFNHRLILDQQGVADFVMQAAAIFEGVLAGADGKPIADGFVGLRDSNQRRGYFAASQATDGQGRFHLEVPAGRKMELIADFHASMPARIEVVSFEAGVPQRVKLTLSAGAAPGGDAKLEMKTEEVPTATLDEMLERAGVQVDRSWRPGDKEPAADAGVARNGLEVKSDWEKKTWRVGEAVPAVKAVVEIINPSEYQNSRLAERAFRHSQAAFGLEIDGTRYYDPVFYTAWPIPLQSPDSCKLALDEVWRRGPFKTPEGWVSVGTPLALLPGKHTVKVLFVALGQDPAPASEATEIEVLPAEKGLKAWNGAWGQAVGGVEVSAAAVKGRVVQGEEPQLVARVRNLGEEKYEMHRRPGAFGLEVDGKEYEDITVFPAWRMPLGKGDEYEIVVPVGIHWESGRHNKEEDSKDVPGASWTGKVQTYVPGQGLPPLSPGKHTLRVILTELGEKVRAASPEVEIEVMAQPPAQPPAAELPTAATAKAENAIETYPAVKATFGDPMFVLPEHLQVQAVAFMADGKLLVSVAYEHGVVTVRTWDVAGRKLLREVTLEWDAKWTRQFGSLMLSKDGGTVISILENQVGVWDAGTGKLVRRLEVPVEMREGFWHQLTCTPDMSVIACGVDSKYVGSALMSDSDVVVWDGKSGRMVQRIKLNNAMTVQSLSFSADGKSLATVGMSDRAQVWDLGSGKLVLDFANSNPERKHPDTTMTNPNVLKRVMSAAFSPDGKELAIGDVLGVKLVAAATGKVRVQMDAPFRYDSGRFVFSGDGELLARWDASLTMKEPVVAVWSVKTGKLVMAMGIDPGCVAFSADRKWLAAGVWDRAAAVKVWAVEAAPAGW